ncbi:unnamed protein product [Heterosigma akashiwo]|uniref:Uncharacterized protein n=1 Tax=Heterosigma akashiwo TaxID=2829 RepID=A0A6V1N8Z5_HETAK|mmetsp:Transcript_10784/g.17362  ORF Transcript_10784/g.17362 Transcript_10784/m.17362 type:complete len:149 (-) Transcript_10784:809-1255(-)
MGGKKKAVKKGGAKKKKSSKSATDEEKQQVVDQNMPAFVLAPDLEEWVTLQLNLLNWSYMNTEYRVKTSTHIFRIKNYLKERHGRIEELIICKDSFSEANEMADEMKTLEDYGVKGAPEDHEPPARCPIFYDFKQSDHHDPLLLVWNS